MANVKITSNGKVRYRYGFKGNKGNQKNKLLIRNAVLKLKSLRKRREKLQKGVTIFSLLPDDAKLDKYNMPRCYLNSKNAIICFFG